MFLFRYHWCHWNVDKVHQDAWYQWSEVKGYCWLKKWLCWNGIKIVRRAEEDKEDFVWQKEEQRFETWHINRRTEFSERKADRSGSDGKTTCRNIAKVTWRLLDECMKDYMACIQVVPVTFCGTRLSWNLDQHSGPSATRSGDLSFAILRCVFCEAKLLMSRIKRGLDPELNWCWGGGVYFSDLSQNVWPSGGVVDHDICVRG